MSNLWINWRFGAWHLQVGPDRPYVSWKFNRFHIDHPPARWFERYGR